MNGPKCVRHYRENSSLEVASSPNGNGYTGNRYLYVNRAHRYNCIYSNFVPVDIPYSPPLKATVYSGHPVFIIEATSKLYLRPDDFVVTRSLTSHQS
jgi:hypothetical protein